MNICYLVREYPPSEVGTGGIGSITQTLARKLVDKGHNVVIIACTTNSIPRVDKDGKINVYRMPIPKLVFGLWRFEKFFPLERLIYSFKIFKFLKKLIKTHNIEIVESAEWGFEGLLFSLGFKRKIPFIVKLHGPTIMLQEYSGLPFPIRNFFCCLFEKIMINKADYVIAVSSFLKEYVIKKYRISNKKIELIYNSIDKNIFFTVDKELKEKKVLFVGKIDELKGVFVLAKAIPLVTKVFPDIKFIFIGSDKINTKKNLLSSAIIKDLSSNSSNIQFLGNMNREDLVKYYQDSTVCVIPSFFESFATVCLEAMACGKPVIITHSSGMKEIVREGKQGLIIPPNNHVELAQAIIKIVSDDKLSQMMGIEARKIVEDNFFESAIDISINFYNKAKKNDKN